MNSALQCEEGIILQMIPYRNYDQILTLFTLNQGVIKLFCKKGKATPHRYMPLTKVEVTFKEKNSELFACEGITHLQSYLNLRKQLIHLETGCDLIRAVSSSQMVGKAASLLYKLLDYYLDKITEVQDPSVLAASFKLKILRHDGLLGCDEWSYKDKALFNSEELNLLTILAHCQSYSQLAQIILSLDLKKRIDQYFLSLLKNGS